MKIGMWTTTASILLSVVAVACAQGPEGVDDPEVAKFGDQVITASELETLAGSSLVALRQQIYDTQVSKLEAEINQRLVQQAAAAEGLTEGEYLRKRIDAMVGEPDEVDIAKLMSQYRSQLADDDVQARAQIIQALVQREKQQRSQELRKVLFAEAGVEILLVPPRVEVAIADGTPSRGPEDAPIVMIEYTDFQCPFCTRVQPALDALMKRYDGHIRHVFKNLPLPMHAEAQLAGAASLCAQDQGKFWEYHDWLFANQRTLNRDSMVAKAGEFGMDVEVFTACIDKGTYLATVRADMAEANSFGITGTPGFLINGRVLTGAQPIEQFEAIIDQELERRGIDVPPKQAAAEATNLE
ncbi:MAG: DsbA family protein [Acidobacteria bacterium]|nr:DsbA family protein [Candidatus Sulfomarinibacter kjeldsenii]